MDGIAAKRDFSQYGNEKNLSIQHYLIKMLNQILKAVDKNSQHEAILVIIGMVRESLIPIMINYFQNREMKVK